MTMRRRKKHRPEDVVAKLTDADAMLNAGKDLAAVLQALEISESTLESHRPIPVIYRRDVTPTLGGHT